MLNIVSCIKHSFTIKNYSAQNVNRVEVEKPEIEHKQGKGQREKETESEAGSRL